MSKRLRFSLLILVLFILALLALLLTRCSAPATPPAVVSSVPAATAVAPTPGTSPTTAAAPAAEVLSPATVEAPVSVVAGTPFAVRSKGPDNPRDFVTIVRVDAPASASGNYVDARRGEPLKLLAPIEAGNYEVRYVTSRSKTILGRAPIVVTEATASVAGPTQAVLGTTVSVSWTGPNNPGDYITIVAPNTPDHRYGNYTETTKGSPLALTMPVEPGDAELRYVTGQGAKVLARQPLKILSPDVALSAPPQVEAGAVFQVTWTGPNNPHDYVTIVPKSLPDGRYENYAETAGGTALNLTAIITPGPAELRYMTGTGARVLTRRAIEVVASKITLDAPREIAAGSPVKITWTGPNHRGDYITVVPQALPDGQYARYADTTKGSPMSIESPPTTGVAEIRYVSGQGSKVLARRVITVVTAENAQASAP